MSAQREEVTGTEACHDRLGEQFEKREQELFGQDGFEKIVEEIAGIERKLGTYELSQFTPPA